MSDTGEFISNYRILTRFSSQMAGELYIVEHTFRADSLALLLLWSSVELSRDGDRTAFLQKSAGSGVQGGSAHIPILDAGVEQQHPYIITAYSTQAEETLQNHLSFIGSVLQSTNKLHPNDPHMQTEAFLRLFTGLTTQDKPSNFAKASTNTQQHDADFSRTNSVEMGRKRIIAGYQHLKLWQRLVLAILVVALLGWGSFALYTHTPAWAATITITPVIKTLNQSYEIGVSADGAAVNTIQANTMQGRKVSFTSRQLKQTIAATGKGHHDATAATGDLVFSKIHLDNPAYNTITSSTLTSLSGVSVTTEGDVPASEGATVTQHTHADQAGSGVTIGAYDFNFPVEIVDTITKRHIGTGYVTNPQSFKSGSDASDFLFVQQSDIDKIATTLVTQLTPETHTKVTAQIKHGERMAGDMQCTPNASPNHKANDQANTVTVGISMTCAVLVYNEQTLLQAASTAYKIDGLTRFGQGYDVVGGMRMNTPVLDTATLDIASFSVQINGVWSFQWTVQRREELLRLIAGRPRDDVMQLLGGREDIKNVSIVRNWFPGNALPANPGDISLVVGKVRGLAV